MSKQGGHTFDVKRENLLPLDLDRLRHSQVSWQARHELTAIVDDLLVRGPFSIVRDKRLAPSGDAHDYCSIAPYFWPDPDSPDGRPWIMRDGEVNPERDHGDNIPLFEFCGTTRLLCLGHALLHDERCADRVITLLRTFFIDPETRMNPHLNYAQNVPGGKDGNCWGLIDTNLLPGVIDALQLLPLPTDLAQGLCRWFTTFGRWFRDSDLGREEAAMPNNHATWHLAETVAFLMQGGVPSEAADLLRQRAAGLASAQIADDGSMPHELDRTLSFDYTTFNLMAFCTLAVQAKRLGVDLGQTFTDRLDRATRFLLPYVGDTSWPWPQLHPPEPSRLIGLFHWAGKLLGNATYLAAANDLIDRCDWGNSYRRQLFGSS